MQASKDPISEFHSKKLSHLSSHRLASRPKPTEELLNYQTIYHSLESHYLQDSQMGNLDLLSPFHINQEIYEAFDSVHPVSETLSLPQTIVEELQTLFAISEGEMPFS